MFFLFWELELVPMFFLISTWGSGRKDISAMKFLLFTFIGSAFMLVGILALFVTFGTFDMTAMPGLIQGGAKPRAFPSARSSGYFSSDSP